MQPAYTVIDAKKTQASELRLVHRKLRALPEGLGTLKHLGSFDGSNNPISNISAGQLPPNITELTLTGCQLASVPACLTNLTDLKQLHLSANSISHADTVFACPYLMHAGLSFNHISILSMSRRINPGSTAGQATAASPQRCGITSSSKCQQHQPVAVGPPAGRQPGDVATASAGSSSQLMSLDLSRNDITDLPAVLAVLKQLSQLKSLSLKGNPVSLLPYYRDVVLEHLPQLLYLDGQKLGSVTKAGAGSRPGTTSSKRRPGSGRPGSASANSVLQHESQAAAFDNLVTPAAPEQVALLVFLELSKHQLTEVSEQSFAAQAATETGKKQQQCLQDMAVAAAGNVSCSLSGSSNDSAKSAAGAAAASVAQHQGGSSKALGTTAAASAVDASVADVALPATALKPITYHMELEAPDGTILCSLPLLIQPPKPQGAAPAAAAAAAAPADSKKGAVKGGKQAPSISPAKPRPGSIKPPAGKGCASIDSGSAAEAAANAAQLRQGSLQVLLQLPVTVFGRNWLTEGFCVKVMKTQHEPMSVGPQQLIPAATTVTPAATAGTNSKCIPSASGKLSGNNSKAGKQTATAAGIGADSLQCMTYPSAWQYEMKQQLLGIAKVVAGDLLDTYGQQQVFEGEADFMPPAPMFSESTGTLLSLKEAAHKQRAVASCRYRLVLHYKPGQPAAAAAQIANA